MQCDPSSTNRRNKNKENRMNRFNARWLIRRDLPEILEIERKSYDIPWSEEDFLGNLRNRNCIGRIIEWNDRVVGYIIYLRTKTSIKIINFAVHPDCRRNGIGKMLFEKMIALNPPKAIEAIVPESNLGAQLFLRSLQFRATEVLRGEFLDQDGYRMERERQLVPQKSPR